MVDGAVMIVLPTHRSKITSKVLDWDTGIEHQTWSEPGKIKEREDLYK